MALTGWAVGQQAATQDNIEAQKAQASIALQKAEAQQLQTKTALEQRDLQQREQLERGLLAQAAQTTPQQPTPQSVQQGLQEQQAQVAQQQPMVQLSTATSQIDQGIQRTMYIAELAAKQGNISAMEGAYTQAADLIHKKQLVLNEQENLQDKQFDKQEKSLQGALNLFSSINDAKDLAQAKLMVASNYPQYAKQFSNITLNQVPYFKQMTQQGIANLREKREAANTQSEMSRRANQSLNEDIRTSYDERRTKVTEQRETRLEKEGGKAVANPSPAAIKTAKAMIKQEFPNLSDTDAEHYAYDVASDAKARQSRNPGLDSGQALNTAMTEKRRLNEINTVNKAWYERGKDTSTYQPKETALKGPTVGTVINGYVFKGGDPNSQSSWEKQ